MQFTINALAFGHHGVPLMPPLTLTLESGQLVAVIGRNGSGKSTLLQTLAGLLPSLAGQVMIKTTRAQLLAPTPRSGTLAFERNLQPSEAQHSEALSSSPTAQEEVDIDFCQLAPLQRARWVSIVLPTTTEMPPLTVQEVVQLGRLPHASTAWRAGHSDPLVDIALEWCGIAHLASRKMHALSDGQRQRVMLARALAQDTPILLLDEPTNFLDFQATEEVFSLLRQLAHEEQKLVIVATHHLDWAKREADKTLEIRH